MAIFVTCVFLLGFEGKETEQARLQGKWRIIAIEAKGELITGEDAKKEQISCSIDGDKLTFIQGKHQSEHTLSVDPKSKPARLDIIYPEGKGTNHAIYKLETNKLTICVSRKLRPNTKEERPLRFTTKREDNNNLYGLVLYIFEREQ